MGTTSETSKGQKGLRIHAILMIGLLVIQYALGMLTNLFVQFPDTNEPGQLWGFANSQLTTVSHIWIGLLLLVSAVILVIRAAGKNNRGWLASAVVGLFAIIVAIYGGVTFISSQADTYSLVMSLGFIVSFVAYGWGLYAARREE